MSELPDNIKRIDVLRLERAKQKPCDCRTYRYEIDNANKLVYCRDCGAIIDPFTALWNLAWHYEHLGDQVQSLLEQRKQIANWKPWLLVFRELESRYRSKEMLPCCPECHKPFYFERINTWTNRRMEELRNKKESEADNHA
jgi:hypothetical protein